MRIVSRIANDVLNSTKTMTVRELSKLFTVAPNMAAKTIRLFPQNTISMLTEGLGEIYDIKEKSDSFMGINEWGYKWKLRGQQIPKVHLAVRTTGGAYSTGSAIGAAGQPFIVAFESSYYNPRDIIKLEDSSEMYVISEASFITEGVFEYTCKLVTNDATVSVLSDYLVAGKTSGPAGNAYPEISDKGYINSGVAMEEYINYITKVRYDWSWSADAASTKFLIEDMVRYGGQMVKNNYITDELWMRAMEQYHYKKEIELIYGKTTMDARGRCFLQDEKGQDIIKGDGLLAQMHSSMKQTYTALNITLLEDILTDMSLKMPKRTGNTILMTTGAQGYKEFGQIMRAEHKGWIVSGNSYVTTKNGKVHLGAEYGSFEFQGNTIIVSANNVFDHPANVSTTDIEGKFLESSKLLFIDMSTYDGVKNIQLIAKDGRSFVTGELDGIGGQDGKTSGKVSTLLDGSAKALIGTFGVIMHNPYSSYMLEKVVI